MDRNQVKKNQHNARTSRNLHHPISRTGSARPRRLKAKQTVLRIDDVKTLTRREGVDERMQDAGRGRDAGTVAAAGVVVAVAGAGDTNHVAWDAGDEGGEGGRDGEEELGKAHFCEGYGVW